MAIVKLSKTRYVKRKKILATRIYPGLRRSTNWLVVWNPWNFMTSPIAGMIQSDELHHFSEGWLNRQLDKVNREAFSELQIRNQCSWN